MPSVATDTSIERALSQYQLPTETLWELRMVLERRYRVKFSEGLSPEARLAMKQTLDDNEKTVVVSDNDVKNTPAKGIMTVSKISTPRSVDKDDDRRKRTISFTDRYRKSSANRLAGDITDDRANTLSAARRAIGGVKVESAMETVEIVVHGNDKNVADEQKDMEDAAKIHSMEKCIVWMDVNDDTGVNSPRPDSRVLRSARTPLKGF